MYIYIISIGKIGAILPLKFEINNFLIICYKGINCHYTLPKPIKVTKNDLPRCLEKREVANILISPPLISKGSVGSPRRNQALTPNTHYTNVY